MSSYTWISDDLPDSFIEGGGDDGYYTRDGVASADTTDEVTVYESELPPPAVGAIVDAFDNILSRDIRNMFGYFSGWDPFWIFVSGAVACIVLMVNSQI